MITRRTFEALKHPEGSEERARLNCSPVTSEYMPSYRYLAADGRQFRTKAEAQTWNLLREDHTDQTK